MAMYDGVRAQKYQERPPIRSPLRLGLYQLSDRHLRVKGEGKGRTDYHIVELLTRYFVELSHGAPGCFTCIRSVLLRVFRHVYSRKKEVESVCGADIFSFKTQSIEGGLYNSGRVREAVCAHRETNACRIQRGDKGMWRRKVQYRTGKTGGCWPAHVEVSK